MYQLIRCPGAAAFCTDLRRYARMRCAKSFALISNGTSFASPPSASIRSNINLAKAQLLPEPILLDVAHPERDAVLGLDVVQVLDAHDESATLRVCLAGEPVSQDDKLALAIFDCQQRYGVTTVFSFHSLNERARMFAEVARGVLGAAEAVREEKLRV